jgi:hypothetical protein
MSAILYTIRSPRLIRPLLGACRMPARVWESLPDPQTRAGMRRLSSGGCMVRFLVKRILVKVCEASTATALTSIDLVMVRRDRQPCIVYQYQSHTAFVILRHEQCTQFLRKAVTISCIETNSNRSSHASSPRIVPSIYRLPPRPCLSQECLGIMHVMSCRQSPATQTQSVRTQKPHQLIPTISSIWSLA